MSYESNIYSGIIFDVDGVIIDSVKIKTDAMRRLFRNNESSIDMDLGGKSRSEKISYFYKKFNNKEISKEKLEWMVGKYSLYVYDKIINANISQDILSLLDNDSYNFYVVSGTPDSELKTILSDIGIIDKFKHVYGSDNKEKYEILSDIKARESRVIYIGDTEKDRYESRKANVDFLKYKFGDDVLCNMFCH